MNNEFKRMQQLAGIKEITLRPSSKILSPKDIEDINLVFGDDFGAGHSEFNLYNPISEQRTQFNFGEGTVNDFEPYDAPEDYPAYQAFLNLSSKPPGAYVASDIWGMGKCPGAPQNAFYVCLEVGISPYYGTPDIILSSPDSSDEGIPVGWFDNAGKYHPDTDHFDDDGNRIA
jgi:hypothetical protein